MPKWRALLNAIYTTGTLPKALTDTYKTRAPDNALAVDDSALVASYWTVFEVQRGWFALC